MISIMIVKNKWVFRGEIRGLLVSLMDVRNRYLLMESMRCRVYSLGVIF